MTDSLPKLRLAILLTGAIFVLELAGGILSHSLALIADTMHVFMDAFALSLSLGAIMLAQLPSTETKTYGWHRLEILAAILNGLFLAAISIFILRKAYDRFLHPQPIETLSMFIAALLGLLGNFFVLLKLKGDHKDINLRSAYLHVLSDFSSSIAVVLGAMIIKWTGLLKIDAVLSMLISGLILYGAIRILNDAGHILLEGVPRGIKLKEVVSIIREVSGVIDVHDLHIWSVCSHIFSLSCHVDIEKTADEKRDSLIQEITALLKNRFGITHTTIQTNCLSCQKHIITQDLSHL